VPLSNRVCQVLNLHTQDVAALSFPFTIAASTSNSLPQLLFEFTHCELDYVVVENLALKTRQNLTLNVNSAKLYPI